MRTALEDIANFIAPKRPEKMLSILNCFYGGEAQTKAEIMRQTGLTQRSLGYYITSLKRWRILLTHRRWMKPCAYSINHSGFHARIDTLLCDALKTLAGDRRDTSIIQRNKPCKPSQPARFIPTSTGRCHSCDTITKTNSDNRCAACFKENGENGHE